MGRHVVDGMDLEEEVIKQSRANNSGRQMGWMIKKKSARRSAVGLLRAGLRWSQGLKMYGVLESCTTIVSN
jgi:hypothetical protein